jgi:signal transduction histidine kinase
VITIAIAVLQYHLYDVRLVIPTRGRLRRPYHRAHRRTITRTVATAVRSPPVVLALHRGPQIETVSVTGAEQDAALVLPLVYRGERMGEMRITPRTPGEPYGRVDRALLDQLASQTSALVYALRRDTELQSTRRRALETVAEERARLGRDLHDGIARCWPEQG